MLADAPRACGQLSQTAVSDSSEAHTAPDAVVRNASSRPIGGPACRASATAGNGRPAANSAARGCDLGRRQPGWRSSSAVPPQASATTAPLRWRNVGAITDYVVRRCRAARPLPLDSRSRLHAQPHTHAMATAPAPAHIVHAPLEGAVSASWGTIALSARDLHERARQRRSRTCRMPAISGDLGVSSTQGTWVITSFAVANAICGAAHRLAVAALRSGASLFMMSSVILFMVASFLCGIAPNIDDADRCSARSRASCAGPMIPLSQTLLLASYPTCAQGRHWRWRCGR